MSVLSLGELRGQIRELVNDANKLLYDGETTVFSESNTDGFCYVIESENGNVTQIRIYTEHCIVEGGL